MIEAIGKAGYKAGQEVCVALDVAASELWVDAGDGKGAPDARTGHYHFKQVGRSNDRTPAEMVEMYAEWIRQYPIVSIEDGLAEGDWSGWELLTRELGGRVQLVGDDIFVTNPSILQRGIERKIANSILIKLNQIGIGHRDARRDRHGARRRLHDGHFTPLGRNRGRDDCGPGGRHRRGPDQDGVGQPHRIAWRSTTSCSASKRNWARRPGTPAARPFGS